MTLKKIIAIIFAVLLLCGCSAKTELLPAAEPEIPPEIAAEPSPEPTAEPIVLNVRISELMSSNKCTINQGNNFYDWLELHNFGSERAELKGFYLNCDGERWPLPDVSLEAGEYLLIFCSGEEDKSLHSSFKLSKDGFDISLESEDGQIFQQLSVPALESDYSAVIEGDSITVCSQPSPGFGSFEQFQASREISSPLIISEVAVYNEDFSYMYGGHYDWVEFKNVSDSTIQLSDYYISDSSSDFKEIQLPRKELKSGEYYVVHCDDERISEGLLPIAFNAYEDEIYLAHKDDGLMDYMLLRDIPYLGSMGRLEGENGNFFFTEISPNSANSKGYSHYAESPVLIGSDGIFNGVDSVRVELYAEGEIYYSLDGSLPNENSIRYEKPFELDKTCVVRAVSIEEGKLNSAPLNLSYIINENHSLPVMSIASEPEELLGKRGLYKNYTQELESYGAAMFYEADGSFSKGCGIELHGLTSKIVSEKKSFTLQFRNRYDGRLNYDVFDNGVTEFSSVILRAAVESTYSSLMHDNLMHQLAKENFPALPMQDYKYCVLYVNGQYWGVYNIREAHSETHYAQHYGVDEDNVTQTKERWNETDFEQVYLYSVSHDMSLEENYRYIEQHLDIDSVIGWTIVQAYSGNIDAHSPNMRFYYLHDSQKLVYALVDLDLGMEDFYAFFVSINDNYKFNYLVMRLMQNQEFKDRMTAELERVLTGGMANEKVHAIIDDFTAQIAAEMPRDAQRWKYDLSGWEYMVERMHRYIDRIDGRAMLVARDFASYAGISDKEFEQIFANVK